MATGARVRADLKVLEGIPPKLRAGLSGVAYAGALTGATLAKEGIRKGRSEWPPLAQSTIERKGHDRIMYDSGKYYGSITAQKGVSLGTATFGTDVEYAPQHEVGEGVPKRAVFEPTTRGSELDSIVGACEAALKALLRV